MNEVQAAFGLLQLQYIDSAFEKRAALDNHYRALLAEIPGVHVLTVPEDTEWNRAYFPIRVDNTYPVSRDELYNTLKKHGIMTRRYFYPLISNFPMYRGLPSSSLTSLPQANQVAEEILCLPIYPDLDFITQEKIVAIIKAPVEFSAVSLDEAS